MGELEPLEYESSATPPAGMRVFYRRLVAGTIEMVMSVGMFVLCVALSESGSSEWFILGLMVVASLTLFLLEMSDVNPGRRLAGLTVVYRGGGTWVQRAFRAALIRPFLVWAALVPLVRGMEWFGDGGSVRQVAGIYGLDALVFFVTGSRLGDYAAQARVVKAGTDGR